MGSGGVLARLPGAVRLRDALRGPVAPWVAALVAGWLVCMPLLGPYGALLGLLPGLALFHPVWEALSQGIWHRPKAGACHGWSWRRCRSASALTALAVCAVLCGLVVWTLWPSLGAGSRALAGAAGLLATLGPAAAAGITWRHPEQTGGNGPLRVPDPPSAARWSLYGAVVLGAVAWVTRTGVLVVAYGVADSPERHARLLDVLRQADRQVQGTAFAPSVTQEYWPLLVAAAGLLAGGIAAALRGLALSRAPATGPHLRPVGQVFLSYARADTAVAEQYVGALRAAGQAVWMDKDGIRPSQEWRNELSDAIRASDAVIVLLSRSSLRSRYCWDECRQALEHGKRILPVLIDGDLAAGSVTRSLREADWDGITRFQRLSMHHPEQFAPAVRETLAFLAREHDWVALHTLLGEQAHAWQHHGHAPERLLRRHELAEAEAWRVHYPAVSGFGAEPTDVQLRFIQASRRVLRRRTRRLVTGSALALAFITAVASFAAATQEDRERQRREALSESLARAADSRPYPGMVAAARLAAAAYGQADTPAARDVMQEQLVRFQKAGPWLAAGGPGFSADSSMYASSSAGRTRIWDLPEWTLRRILPGELPHDPARALSADGGRVLLFDGDGRARVADTRTGRTVARGPVGTRGRLPPRGGLTPDGQRFLASTSDVTAVIARVDGRGLPLGLLCLDPSLSPHGRFAWCAVDESGADGATGRLVSVTDGSEVGFPRSPMLAGWTADDRPVVTLRPDDGRKAAVQVLDPVGPESAWSVRTGEDWEAASVSADGTRLALSTSLHVNQFEVWDLRRRARLGTVEMRELAERGLHWDAVHNGEEDLGRLVEAEPVHGMPVASFNDIPAEYHDPDRRASVWYSPDRRSAVTATGEGWWAWRLDGWGRVSTRVTAPGLRAADAEGSDLSADGRTLAVTDYGGRLLLFETGTGRLSEERRLAGHGVQVAYSPDGRTLAVGELIGDERTGMRVQIGLFSATSLRRTGTLYSPTPPDGRAYLVGLAFSPDGERLYAAESQLGGVRTWSLADRRMVRTYQGENYLDGMVLSPDGRTLVTSDRKTTVILWDTATGRQRYRLPYSGHRVAFSSDGRRIVTTGESDGTGVAVWDVARRRRIGPVMNLGSDGSTVRDATFTPDGQALLVVAQSLDTTDLERPATFSVRRWELGRQSKPGPVLAQLPDAESLFHIAPDGRGVVAADSDAIIRITTDPAAWQRSLCDLAGRWITPEEWHERAPEARYPAHCAPPPNPD
ncbi:TIR domain-containing protein [Streptomyces luteogriseus]|uniref:TIR domain-containing protein n=1 Tax=Streptomyces luteogriseus TaxID=68233 RepID=UPI0033C403AC